MEHSTVRQNKSRASPAQRTTRHAYHDSQREPGVSALSIDSPHTTIITQQVPSVARRHGWAPLSRSCIFPRATGRQKKSRCVMVARDAVPRNTRGLERSRGGTRSIRKIIWEGRLHSPAKHFSREHTQHDITLPSRILLTGSITDPLATWCGEKRVSQCNGLEEAGLTSFLSPPPSTHRWLVGGLWSVTCSSMHTNDNSVYTIPICMWRCSVQVALRLCQCHTLTVA